MNLSVEEFSKQIIENPVCCDKKMLHISDIGQLDRTVTDGEMWLCLECGSYFEMKEGQLDEEEIENYKNSYEVE